MWNNILSERYRVAVIGYLLYTSAIAGILVCFIPVIIGSNLRLCQKCRTFPIDASIHATSTRDAVVGSLSIALLFMLELWLDLFSESGRKYVSRCLRIFSLFAPNMMFAIAAIASSELEIWPSVVNFQLILLAYSFSYNLLEFGKLVWTRTHTVFITVLFTVAAILNNYSSYYSSFRSPYIYAPFIYIGILLFLYKSYYWFRYVYQVTIINGKLLSHDDYICSVHVVCVLIYILVVVLVENISPVNNIENISAWQISFHVYSASILIAVVSVLCDRVIRRDFANIQQSLEIQRMFIRYISHEMRTPLNTAFLGLKLLSDDLRRDGSSADRLDTVKDVKDSCDIAINILNELLVFDKLQTGLLHLESEHVAPWSFIQDTVKTFYIQARAAGIDLKFEDPEMSRLYLQDTYIVADKHKLEQVVRNLVSNALKFTPKDGTVTIRVKREGGHRSPSPTPSRMPGSSYFSSQRLIQFGSSSLTRLETKGADQVRSPKRAHMLGKSSSSGVSGGGGVGSLSLGGGVAVNAFDSVDDGDMDRFLEEEEILVVEVVDTGAGISAVGAIKENQTKLFKEIIQFSPGKLQAGGGSGLGLYITKGIVELHNGHISVFSAGEGLGCTFTLELPLYRETPASSKDTFAEHGLQIRIPQRSDHFASRHNVSPNPVVTPQRRSKDRGSVTGPASSTPGRPFRMLVVDDSALNRKMLCRYVGPRCEVLLEAADGEQALAKYREAAESGKPLDVVLMDNNMPRKSGPQAAKEMRALGYKGYIIGITGNAVAADMEEYLKSGADKVLSKPIDVIALESVLSESRQEQQQVRRGRSLRSFASIRGFSFSSLPPLPGDLEN